MSVEQPCDTCPRYQSLLGDTADYARRVAIADARASELQQNGLGILTALHDSVDSLERSTQGLTEDDMDTELMALTMPEDEAPNLHKEADTLAQQLIDSIPRLRQRRHDELDCRLEAIRATPAFCTQMGACGIELMGSIN